MKKDHVAADKPHVAALKRAIEIAGGQAQLAAAIAKFIGKNCKVSQQTVSYWLTNEVELEAKWWPAFEHVTEGEITGAHLRPDVFKRSVVLANHVG